MSPAHSIGTWSASSGSIASSISAYASAVRACRIASMPAAIRPSASSAGASSRLAELAQRRTWTVERVEVLRDRGDRRRPDRSGSRGRASPRIRPSSRRARFIQPCPMLMSPRTSQARPSSLAFIAAASGSVLASSANTRSAARLDSLIVAQPPRRERATRRGRRCAARRVPTGEFERLVARTPVPPLDGLRGRQSRRSVVGVGQHCYYGIADRHAQHSSCRHVSACLERSGPVSSAVHQRIRFDS